MNKYMSPQVIYKGKPLSEYDLYLVNISKGRGNGDKVEITVRTRGYEFYLRNGCLINTDFPFKNIIYVHSENMETEVCFQCELEVSNTLPITYTITT